MTTLTELAVDSSTAHPLLTATTAARRKAARRSWTRAYALRLTLGDAAAVLLAVAGAHVLRFGFDSEAINSVGMLDGLVQQTQVSFALAVIWFTALRVFDTRSRRIIGAGSTEYKRVVDASVLTFVVYLVAAYFLQLSVARSYALIVFPLVTVAILANRWLWRQWLIAKRRRGEYSSQVILVGSPAEVRRTARDLMKQTQHGYRVVGVSLTGANSDTVLSGTDIPVVGSIEQVPGLLAQYGADTVLVTGSEHLSADRVREMSWGLDPLRHQLLLAPSITDVAGSRVHLRPVAGLPLVQVETPNVEGPHLVAKRAFDVTLSGLMLAALLPLFAVIGLLVRRADGGPVFYTQERIGRDGERFRIFKFRSMYTDADARRAALVAAQGGKGLFKMKDDPRVTPVGKVLRKYSLDELPQLINVFRGEMSLVGPRPALAEEVAEYDDKARRRLVVTPGLSGLWQVSGRSNLEWEDGIRLDLYYVENWSMTGDLIILWRTAKTVLFPDGAY
ncbi:sugar transferase [Herbiconiux sp. L3-i23]|uniref:sugar transferase n=1 Tax=Herbiconiux sp. L3-i23 TaxID=2905871 RepID=UPI002052EA5D|nr:sugar transferase [Herbiconiux sp. L3-i23]BDI21933.1 polyprenyl glycosylphosphotransferase [Herbiconiux sp. L3-i23]